MQLLENILLRKTLAAMVFFMAFLLTPRAWVDEGASGAGLAEIPVDQLERPDNCLWCTPVQPVDCETSPRDGAGADAPASPDRFWLNPDAPPPESESTPCPRTRDDDERAPSA